MIELPKDKLGMLKGHHEAQLIAENTTTAYWLYGRDDSAALLLLEHIHRDLAALADKLGYTIAPKVAPVEAPAEAVTA